jgi:hypothetical protein
VKEVRQRFSDDDASMNLPFEKMAQKIKSIWDQLTDIQKNNYQIKERLDAERFKNQTTLWLNHQRQSNIPKVNQFG